ncbi:hypothetical protein HDU67_010057 [Dinochytrium kinnereticum]|nr:hypothetical protein HDU67_010057 [Dinochytrium kinnereticum]
MPSGSNLNDSVLYFHLLNVIQTNDLTIILPALQDYLLSSPHAATSIPSFGSPLHLAISICSRHVVEQIINAFFLSATPLRPKELFWVNDQNHPDGDTPLHLAARAKNFEIVDHLLRIEGIDDSIRNAMGRTPEEVVPRTDFAAEKVIELFRRDRVEFIARTTEKLRSCVSGRTTYAVLDFLSRDRRVQAYFSCGLMDINAPLDPTTDATILHFAAREDSSELVEWCLRKGADPEIKDRKGRRPVDLLPKKDSRARDKLRGAVSQPLIVQAQPASSPTANGRISNVQPPTVRGILKKWVNYSSGWKARYFSLEKGTLSYYKSEADYPESCRGSIATRIAIVEFPDAKDKSRFDVVGKGSVRFCLQARSPADAKRWVWALMESKRWVTDNDSEAASLYGTVNGSSVKNPVSDDEQDVDDVRYDYQVSGDIPPPPQGYDFGSPVGGSSASGSPQRQSLASIPMNRLSTVTAGAQFSNRDSFSSKNDTPSRLDSFPTTNTEDLATLAHLLQVQMDVQNRVVEAVVEGILQGGIGGQAIAPPRLSSSSFNGGTSTPTPPGAQGGFLRDVDVSNLPSLMRSSMKQVADTIGRVLTVAEAKERKFKRREQKNADRIKRLEAIIQNGLTGTPTAAVPSVPATTQRAVNNTAPSYHGGDANDDLEIFHSPHSPNTAGMANLAITGEIYDMNLSPQMNIPGSLTGGMNRAPGQNEEEDSEDSDIIMDMHDAEEELDNDIFYDAADGILPRTFTASSRLTVRSYRSQVKPSPTLAPSASTTVSTPLATASVTLIAARKEPVLQTIRSSTAPSQSSQISLPSHKGEDSLVEEPTAPTRGHSLKMHAPNVPGLAAPPSYSPPSYSPSLFLNDNAMKLSCQGHIPDSQTRQQPPLDPNKPKPVFQAWSFIKSAIGKDLSKVTLPVFFNEPLSMLQRMGEDVEYVELLSLASRIGRPKIGSNGPNPAGLCAKELGVSLQLLEGLRGEESEMGRLLYVAAYAMSNYSSTVGRTTKPFNPLLGETFELVSDEKQFRYVSEQVCHHPPISACYADSPDWVFWTEVNVKSKFWGSSLELHPLGNCHIRLPLPADVPGEPGASEHYAWKKVTTTVNNLIVGKLTITHLGDMVIRNWRTGDECILTFRPKSTGSGGSWFGWGSGGSGEASEKSAQSATDASGVGEIVGVYKDRNGNIRWNLTGSWGDKLIATRVGPLSGAASQSLPSTLTLWQRKSSHPLEKFFFNQTPFAMKLNELSETLRPYLPPTDSRLRQDQRAMEEGMWEDANKGKEFLEVVQRTRRRGIVKEFEVPGKPSGPPENQHPPNMAPHLRNNGGGGIDGGVGGTPIQIGEAWWIPRWFVRTLDPETGEPHWVFTHEYWEARGRGKWPEWVVPVFEPPPEEQ